MEDRRVKKDAASITLHLEDKSTIDGSVFLRHYKMHDSKPENVGELLNRYSFIPVRISEGIVLINVMNIVKVVVPSGQELDENTDTFGVRYHVDIRLVDGSSLKGDFLIDLPEEHQRVKDYLNQPDRFLRLLMGGTILYLNRKYVLNVVDA